ncbi:MAG: penicillin-binding protein 2 [Methylococcales bacterium]|jgi:cell division protein FtsI (penicillin-binding protein 3)|nr:penicillin-binding protein 2 [Methylococcales bacterium]
MWVTESHKGEYQNFPKRKLSVLVAMSLVAIVLMARSIDVQVINNDQLQNQGDKRHIRTLQTQAYRGKISDRFGRPLAISTQVHSIFINPRLISKDADWIADLADILDLKKKRIINKIEKNKHRYFAYIKRWVTPATTAKVNALIKQHSIKGLSLLPEYRRFYPMGEMFAQVVGFTNIDDKGQEGIELAYNHYLKGTPGKLQIKRDAKREIIETIGIKYKEKIGNDLVLSLDSNIQHLLHRELKIAFEKHNARSASAVILDVNTGEVVAMSNQPSFNPNNRSSLNATQLRNRAVTDVFEPGSTVKPFTVAIGLESGLFNEKSLIDTTEGRLNVGSHLVKDIHDYGKINLATVIRKSSNVGASTIALSLDSEFYWRTLSNIGFGEVTQSGFPGETTGKLFHYKRWSRFKQASMAFGYGFSLTTLQLAKAYVVLASGGYNKPISFTKVEGDISGTRVFSRKTTEKVLRMMEAVVREKDGTGQLAQIKGYRIAGKTGTVHKYRSGGYEEARYLSLFSGVVPASNPKYVMVTMVNDPKSGKYYGGQVAAPVFSNVMSKVLRMKNVLPDDLSSLDIKTANNSWTH